jgi:hypothetical protein
LATGYASTGIPGPEIVLELETIGSVAEDKPGSIIAEESPGSIIPEDKPGSIIGEESPGSTTPEDNPGSIIGEESPGSTIPEDNPGSITAEERNGSIVIEELYVAKGSFDPRPLSSPPQPHNRSKELQNNRVLEMDKFM